MKKNSIAYLAVVLTACLLASVAYAVDVVENPYRDDAVVARDIDGDYMPATVGGVSNTVRLVGFLIGLAILAAILYWIFSRDRVVYRDPTINPNNTVNNPNLTNPGSNEPSYRNTVV